ncbi:hypothetical protein MUO66_00865 [Candidatus Bathyarchaeota archaeon]|nr:hypothetical protein [Candidatus Bathyarchaeota archaeon]
MQTEKITTNYALPILKQKNETLIIIEAIDESFALFINSKKFNIFIYLEEKYGIIKQNIPENIEKTVNIIETLFGSAAKLIEIKIIELIHKKICDFTYNPQKGDLFFKQYLLELLTFLRN